MVFRKVLAAAGVANAKIDAQLDTATVDVGGTITGDLVVEGGSAEQEVQSLEVVLVVDAVKTDDETEVPTVLARTSFDESFTIGARETRRERFSLAVPAGTPPALTEFPARVYVTSQADVEMSVDPSDEDAVTVRPPALHTHVVQAMTALGHVLKEEHALRTRKGVLQELVFHRTDVPPDEAEPIEIAFLPAPGNSYDIIVDQDLAERSSTRLLADALDLAVDDSAARVHMSGGPDGPGYDIVFETLKTRLGHV